MAVKRRSKASIFISHSTFDIQFAKVAQALLQAHGCNAFLLYEDKAPSVEKIDRLVRQKIKQQEWLVRLNSRHVEKSVWMQFEATYAQIYKKPIFEIDLEQCWELSDQTLNTCLDQQITRIVEDITLFITYSHRDGARMAEQLYRDLSSEGFAIFFDKQSLQAGESWSDEIEGAIKSSAIHGFFLFLISYGSLNSRWALEELESAIAQNARILPCLIDAGVEAYQIPHSLREIQWIDFRHDYAAGYHHLRSAMTALSGK